jgi:hypothetical protein
LLPQTSTGQEKEAVDQGTTSTNQKFGIKEMKHMIKEKESNYYFLQIVEDHFQETEENSFI